jgi:glycosyltransferase involved in cell wall biosynthesis
VDTAVIVSTFNAPESLRLSLLGFAAQKRSQFEVVVADDGSGPETAQVLADPALAGLPIRHVWHEDRGFRLCTIRNRAIAATEAEYLIFCDGDCIPRDDFVANHIQHRRPGCFVSGSRIDVCSDVFRALTDEEILSGRIFEPKYLTERDPSTKHQHWRLSRNPWYQGIFNLLTWRFCVFIGSNSAAWRDDLQRVNGFDEDHAGYGSEDRDMGVRLRNAGVRSKYLKFSLVQLHLRHLQPWIDPAIAQANRRRMKRRFLDGTTWVPNGLDSVAARA